MDMVKVAVETFPEMQIVLRCLQSKKKHRHCPLGGVDRNQSPDPIIIYTWDIPKPIEYDPNHNTTVNSDRGGQTPQIVPHPSPNIPNATSTGSSRPHIGDSPPRDGDEKDKMYKEKWRHVFCKYAADQNREVIENTKDALLKPPPISRRPQRNENS